MISVRVMWTEREERQESLEITKIILRALREHGYKTKRSRIVPNRKNPGGRIFIKLRKKIK